MKTTWETVEHLLFYSVPYREFAQSSLFKDSAPKDLACVPVSFTPVDWLRGGCLLNWIDLGKTGRSHGPLLTTPGGGVHIPPGERWRKEANPPSSSLPPDLPEAQMFSFYHLAFLPTPSAARRF